MKTYKFTYIGLFISYFSIILIGLFYKTINGGSLGNIMTIIREITTLLTVGILIWIILKKEQLPLSSIGLIKNNWKNTIIWTLITLVFCLAGIFISLFIIQSLGWEFGKDNHSIKLSPWATAIVCLRAGIAEEVFFRGYIYERFQFLLKKKWIAVALSLIPFSLFHYSQGLSGILMAFIIGGILTGMYLWKRNLKVNIIAHFLIDFIPNVLLSAILL